MNDCAHGQLIILEVKYVDSMQVLSVHLHNVVINERTMSVMRPMKYFSLTRQHFVGFEFSENGFNEVLCVGKKKFTSRSVRINAMEHLNLSTGV